MSVRVWVRGRVRMRASDILRGHKAVGYARSGDHVVLYESLCCELQFLATMGFKLVTSTVGLL